MTEQEINTFCRSVVVHRNPWKLTPHQCLALHLICKHGTLKASSVITGIPETTLKWHLKQVRDRLKKSGKDIRIYLMWHHYEKGVLIDVPKPQAA
jgi:hypothetical protein